MVTHVTMITCVKLVTFFISVKWSQLSQCQMCHITHICHNIRFVTFVTVFTFVTMSHLSQYSHMSQQLQWSSGHTLITVTRSYLSQTHICHNIRFVTFVTILSLYLQSHTKN